MSKPMKELVEKTSPVSIHMEKKPALAARDQDSVTGWEYYSALPVHTSRDARIHPEKNINLRGCRWGSEICGSCMECISNINENDILPHPELDFWDQEEEMERSNAVMPVA